MSYVTTSGHDRKASMVAVLLLHAAFGAVFLSLGGYAVVKQAAAPFVATFVDETPPPPDTNSVPDTTIDTINPVLVAPVFEIRKETTHQTPVVVQTSQTPVDPGPVTQDAGTHDAGPLVVDQQPVTRDVVRTLALYDPRYNDLLQPHYPSAARALGLEGAVTLDIIIGIDGRVQDARVVISSNAAALDAAAVRHVRKYWRFKPATEDGKPVVSSVKRRIIFKLDSQRG